VAAIIKERTYTVASVREALMEACINFGSGGQTKLAERLGLSRQYISDVINGKRPPSARILAYLNLRKVDVYKEAK
jgi:transcriptional regulator with XRE-family HTH domain